MSTIFADKFKNTSGGNPIQINQLRGIDTAGSITVQGEGNATTNLQQGLAKVWAEMNGTSTISLDDSFNVGGVTDNGTGQYTFTYSNAFSTGNNSVQGTSNAVHTQGYDSQTTYAELRTYGSATSAFDTSRTNLAVFGDLA